MRKLSVVILLAALLVQACGKKEVAPKYEKSSRPYQFFRFIADSMGVDLLDPDARHELIKTKKFTVYSPDVMDVLFQSFGAYPQYVRTLSKEKLEEYVLEVARREAEVRMMVEDAKEKGIKANPDTVQARLNQIYANYGGKEVFESKIKKQGITPEYVLEDVTRATILDLYFKEVVFPRFPISEEELKEVYNQDKTATVRHILLQTRGKSDEEKAQIRKKMESILKEARSGKDFAELAKKYSEDPGSKNRGGIYEKFGRGVMVKPFEDAAFSVPVGQISDIIETQFGYHILKVLSRERETRPFAEVKDSLLSDLRERRKGDYVKTIVEELKKKFGYKELIALPSSEE